MPHPVFIDFNRHRTFGRIVRIFRLAFLSVWCIVFINITKQPMKPFLLRSFWRWLMSFVLQPSCKILDCTIWVLDCTVQIGWTARLEYSVNQTPLRFSDNFFPTGWEFLINFLHTYYTILSTLDYKFLFNYFQLWRSYAILSATTQQIFTFH